LGQGCKDRHDAIQLLNIAAVALEHGRVGREALGDGGDGAPDFAEVSR
jgi:hypothetical protein